MKLYSIILLILIMLIPGIFASAQNPVSAIDSLEIDLWPDYDRASVLVLLTGTLPADTRFPASVSIILPKQAQLNAVARIDGKDGNMKDDISSNIDIPGLLTFVTPDLRFRVEYYLPYAADADQRSFDYTWTAPLGVNNLQLRVQRPKSASSFATEPVTANVIKGGDGFDYYTFPSQPVPAGQSFALRVDYKNITGQLSVAALAPVKTDPSPSAAAGKPAAAGPGVSLALAAVISGGIIIVAALFWQLASRRKAPDDNGHSAKRSEKKARAKFCRKCGDPVSDEDRFCGGCGTEI